jgi:hypothetical protein
MATKQEIRDIYGKRAGNYDFTVQLYHLLGFGWTSIVSERSNHSI